MKKIIVFFVSLSYSLALFSQVEKCQNFNENTVSEWATNSTCSLVTLQGNWKARMARLKYDNMNSQDGPSDVYLKIKDKPSSVCQSWIFNNTDFNGNWPGISQCFCYDFRLFNGGNTDTPPSALRIYSGADNPFSAPYVAEFILNDPISIEYGWTGVCTPIQLAGFELPANSFGHWEMKSPEDGGPAEWNSLISNVDGIAFKVDINSGTEEYGIDNICFKQCPTGQEPIPTYCCPGRNLIKNGSFEDGNVGFSSEYMYQSVASPNSVVPGQYGILNGGQAADVSPTWSSVQAPATCSNTSGKFLIVNGENGGGATPAPLSNSIPSTKIIWEQTLAVKDWEGYKFCFKAKNLDQCGFNVTPKIDVVFSLPVGNISETITAPAGACEWQDITKNFNLWGYGNTLNIKIILDQNEFGDGNDIAIDDIALIQLERCPAESANFDISTSTPHPNNPNAFTVTASADMIAPCNKVWWEVCKVDLATMECESTTQLNEIWWDPITNFPGYIGADSPSGDNPGLFEFGVLYKITRGTWGTCHRWIASSKYVGQPTPGAQMQMYTEEEFEARKTEIARIFGKKGKESAQEKRLRVDESQNAAPRIFPNPTTGKVTLEMKVSQPLEIAIDVYNSEGRRVHSFAKESLSDGYFRKEWSGGLQLPPGLYIFHFKTNQGVFQEKVLIGR